MKKAELINYVAEQVELSKATATKAVNSVFAAIKLGLSRDGNVAITDHGTYSVTTRAAREVPHPRTRELMQVPETKQVKFKVGKDLKAEVNK